MAKPAKVKEVDAWTEQQVSHFLSISSDHRWAIAFRLELLYGLRPAEVLAVRWSDVDRAKGRLRIDEGLVAVNGGIV